MYMTLSRHDDRGQRHVPRPEEAEGKGRHLRRALRKTAASSTPSSPKRRPPGKWASPLIPDPSPPSWRPRPCRLLRIAEAVDILVIVHLTNAAALREVEAARKRGQQGYAETCPQYLLLDDSVYNAPTILWRPGTSARPHPQDRGSEGPVDGPAPWRNQTISTDHCSFTLAQKDAGRGILQNSRRPAGVEPGELIYTAGVTTRKISLATMCRVLAENPAKLYGMFPGRASCRPGADADIVVYDPLADHVIRAADTVANGL